MLTAAPPKLGARRGSRLVGVDVARGVALLGMVAVHVLPRLGDDGEQTLVRTITSGRSAALFAVLAGVGLALAADRWLWRGRLVLVVRAVGIGAVGLALGALDSGVAVILAYYAALFVLVQPFLSWRPRPLLLLAGVWALVLPAVSFAVRDELPARDVDNPVLDRLAGPDSLLAELTLTGYYPALPWLAYLLLGLGVGRLALRSTRVAVRLAAAGAALAALAHGASSLLLGPLGGGERIGATLGLEPGPELDTVLSRGQFGNVPTDTSWWLAVDSPHTTTPLDLLATGGTALLVLGLSLLVVPLLGPLLAPLAAVGSMPLTLYTAHVTLLGFTDTDDPTRYYLLQVAAALVFATLWRRRVGRGPLESALALLTRPIAGRVRT